MVNYCKHIMPNDHRNNQYKVKKQCFNCVPVKLVTTVDFLSCKVAYNTDEPEGYLEKSLSVEEGITIPPTTCEAP